MYMVMKNKALIRDLEVLINNQYASNMHANKQLVNSENWTIKLKFYDAFLLYLEVYRLWYNENSTSHSAILCFMEENQTSLE